MPRPRLVDTEKIVNAALAIADADGLQAVSMRSVSDRLGVAAPALYRHVVNKDELLARMADSVLATLPELRVDVGWRTAVVEYFAALRDLMLEHHGLAELMLLRTAGSPPMLRAADSVLQAMQDEGIDTQDAVTTLAMLQWVTLGAALHGAARVTRRDDELPPAIATADPATYPVLARASARFPEGERREQFREGLNQLLAGVHPRGKPRVGGH